MSRWRRPVTAVAAAIVGIAAGSTIALSADRFWTDPAPSPTAPFPVEATPETIDEEAVAAPHRSILLAWSPGGLPSNARSILSGLDGIEDSTVVVAGPDWLVSTRDDDGAVIDRPAPGFAIPLDVAVVSPREFARFVPSSERSKVESMGPGEVLLSETSAGLRQGDAGMTLRFRDGRKLVVTGVISDEAASGYEAVIAGPVPGSWKVTYPFALARAVKPTAKQRVAKRLGAALPSGEVLRVRAFGETPFLRYGDAVLPDMLVKRTFGEFAVRPEVLGGVVQIAPRWRRANIRTGDVPILGNVTCHRTLFPQLSGALAEIEAAGLAHAIDPSDYGGCFGPRFINGAQAGRLSHHAWGIAIDIDVAENTYGTRPDQDRRVVEIFERYGFTWGGRWLRPDGMHFEWGRFP